MRFYSRANPYPRTKTVSRYNPLKGTGSVKKRKRAPPVRDLNTAKRRRVQIRRNTAQIRRLNRLQRLHRVYTDYQLCEELRPPAAGPQGGIEGFSTFQLTNVVPWDAVMREDNDAVQSSRTYVRNCLINFRYLLNDASEFNLSLFIVTPRKNLPNVDVNNLLVNKDYVANTAIDGTNVRLNPAIFKVHYARYMTLVANKLGTPPVAAQNVGNPNTTWGKGQVSLPLKMSIMQPTIYGTANSWKEKPFEDFPYYHKYYILCYFNAVVPTTGTPNYPMVTFDALFTCINTD